MEHPHSFTFCSERHSYQVNCTSSGTVLQSLESSRQFNKIVGNKFFVIEREKRSSDGVIAEHFPCKLIRDKETLTIRTFKEDDEAKVKKCEDAKVKQEDETQDTEDLRKTKAASGELITFTVNTTGGKYTKTKQIVKNKILNDFKTLGVYAYSDETVESALRRDGRFADIVFQDGCTLDKTDSKMKVEINQNVKGLDGQNYEISLPRGKPGKSTGNRNPERPTAGPKIKTENSTASEVPQSVSEDQSETTKKTRMKKSHRNPSSVPDYGEIMNILREQFPDLVNQMHKRISKRSSECPEQLQLIKKDFVKKTQSFTYMCQLEKLVHLSSSVGRIQVGSDQGTAFLLFDNFVLTNAHVIKNSYNDNSRKLRYPATVNFDLKNRRPLDKEFPLSSDVCAYRKGRDEAGRYVDFALLKLQNNSEEISELPRLLHEFTSEQNAQGICIIGHPGADVKRMDVSCIVPHRADGSQDCIQVNVNFQGDHSKFEIVGERSFIATYNTCFLEGSSGSPVFDEQCKLIAMHTAGFLTDRNEEHIIEFGIPLCSIIWNILEQLAARDSPDEIFTFIKEATQNPHLEGFLLECVKVLVPQQSLSIRHKELLAKIYTEANKNNMQNLLQMMNPNFSNEKLQENAQLDENESTEEVEEMQCSPVRSHSIWNY